MEITQQHIDVFTGKICPHCGNKTEYIDSSYVYGKSYGMIYICRPCKAWVGVHKGTNKALGRVANAELREWKIKAHDAFDKLWRGKKRSRSGAYKWLSDNLGIPPEYTHIGMFSVATCKKVIELVKSN